MAAEIPVLGKYKVHDRVLIYLSVGAGLTFFYAVMRGTNWQGSAELHTIMEVAATLLAFIVGAMALVRYYTKKNNTFLFIGAGFLGTAFLDGYHALVTSNTFKPLMPSDLPALIPWSWVASRQFLSVFLFLSWLAWWRQQQLDGQAQVSEKAVYLFSVLFTFLSFMFFAFAPLPRAYYSEFIFHRPEEFLPALFFLAALIGYLRKENWRHDIFEHWLVISLVVGVVSQMVFMSFSGVLFDFEFDAAHLLKKISYVCVLIGLFGSMYSAFRQETIHGEAMAKEKNNAEIALAKLASHKLALDEHCIVAITDPLGTITYANDKFCEISKYSKEELLGANHRIVNSGHHPKSFFADMYKTIAKGNSWHGEIKNNAKDGTLYWVDTTIIPFTDRNGRIVEYIAIRTDITFLKQTKEKLLLSNDNLQSANIELERFAYIASHDLQEPLRKIETCSAILQDELADKLEPENQEIFDIMIRGSKRMRLLVTDVLNYSRVVSNDIPVEKVDLNSVVQTVVSDLDAFIAEHGANVIFDDLPVIEAGETQLGAVFQNLIVNGIKFNKSKKPLVTIRAKADDGFWKISIADNGIGIDDEFQINIFNMFERLHSQHEYSGTGIGLAMVKKIVEQYGGEIRIDNTHLRDEETTVFLLHLPQTDKRAVI